MGSSQSLRSGSGIPEYEGHSPDKGSADQPTASWPALRKNTVLKPGPDETATTSIRNRDEIEARNQFGLHGDGGDFLGRNATRRNDRLFEGTGSCNAEREIF
jgi:hypothetical protein